MTKNKTDKKVTLGNIGEDLEILKEKKIDIETNNKTIKIHTTNVIKELSPKLNEPVNIVTGAHGRGKSKKDKEKDKGKKFNISQLNISHLQKYRKVHKLTSVKVRSSREELVKAATAHFNSVNVNEAELIASFVYHVSKKKTKIYSALID